MRLTEVPSHGHARIGDALVRPVQPRVGEVLTGERDFPLSASPEAQAAAYDLGKLKSAAQVPHTGDVGFGETAYPKPDFDKRLDYPRYTSLPTKLGAQEFRHLSHLLLVLATSVLDRSHG